MIKFPCSAFTKNFKLNEKDTTGSLIIVLSLILNRRKLVEFSVGNMPLFCTTMACS